MINISDGVNTMLKYTLDGDNIIFEGSAGDYSLVIVNIETSNIMSSNDTINFTVGDSRRDLDVNITQKYASVSCSPSFVLDTLDDFKGRVNITVDGRTWVRDFNSSVSIDKLSAGEYNASFVFYHHLCV